MRNRKARSRSPKTRDFAFRVYVLLACLSFGLGAVVLSGGEARFSGPAFQSPRDIVSWLPLFEAWVYWGALFVFQGVALALAAKRHAAVHVLRFGLCVYASLAVFFVASVFQQPTAAATGCVIYLGFAILHLMTADHLEQFGWEE